MVTGIVLQSGMVKDVAPYDAVVATEFASLLGSSSARSLRRTVLTTIVIVNPAAENEPSASVLAPRLRGLDSRRIALIDNSKHHADEFLAEVKRLLTTQCGVTEFVRYRKSNASIPMPADALDDVVARCDAVVHAVAD